MWVSDLRKNSLRPSRSQHWLLYLHKLFHTYVKRLRQILFAIWTNTILTWERILHDSSDLNIDCCIYTSGSKYSGHHLPQSIPFYKFSFFFVCLFAALLDFLLYLLVCLWSKIGLVANSCYQISQWILFKKILQELLQQKNPVFLLLSQWEKTSRISNAYFLQYILPTFSFQGQFFLFLGNYVTFPIFNYGCIKENSKWLCPHHKF